MELAEAGYMPHYRIDGGPPMFKKSEARAWVSSNLIERVQGRAIPSSIRVVVPAPEVVDRPPSTISNVPGLQQIPKSGYQPGVYFLCKGEQVVYVGQSVHPAARIATHDASTTKDFDRVYLLPVPQSELDDTESAFIKLLHPPQQGGVRLGNPPAAPRGRTPARDVFARFGFDAEGTRTEVAARLGKREQKAYLARTANDSSRLAG